MASLLQWPHCRTDSISRGPPVKTSSPNPRISVAGRGNGGSGVGNDPHTREFQAFHQEIPGFSQATREQVVADRSVALTAVSLTAVPLTAARPLTSGWPGRTLLVSEPIPAPSSSA